MSKIHMTLKEAVNKAKAKDKLHNSSWICNFIREDLTSINIPADIAIRDDWYITPAKEKYKNPDELVESLHDGSKVFTIPKDIIKAANKNRDLLYAPLLKHIKEWYKEVMTMDLLDSIKNTISKENNE